MMTMKTTMCGDPGDAEVNEAGKDKPCKSSRSLREWTREGNGDETEQCDDTAGIHFATTHVAPGIAKTHGLCC